MDHHLNSPHPNISFTILTSASHEVKENVQKAMDDQMAQVGAASAAKSTFFFSGLPVFGWSRFTGFLQGTRGRVLPNGRPKPVKGFGRRFLPLITLAVDFLPKRKI